MTTAFNYTILAGDTYSTIAAGVTACQGVTAAQIQTANPDTPPIGLTPGQVIVIPSPATDHAPLDYTVQQGDSYYVIAKNIDKCPGITAQDIQDANRGVDPSKLQIGQIIAIPAAPAKPLSPTAPNMGYWNHTWRPCASPPDATMGMAFSGWSDPVKALADSQQVMSSLVGKKYITLGGGDSSDNGKFTQTFLLAIENAISTGAFVGYDGIAFDVEIGDSGLALVFEQTFALAKSNGFQVLVTVSHSAPFKIDDAAALMSSFFSSTNIDFLSPQLYTTGEETQNDYSLTTGVSVTWQQYATAKALIVPSIVSDSLYADAQRKFATYGVELAGYVVWNVGADGAT
jgi:LysM repeat protein